MVYDKYTVSDVEKLVVNHCKVARKWLMLEANTNVASPSVRYLMSSDLVTRYLVAGTEGFNLYMHELERMLVELGKELFGCNYLGWRATGGQIAGNFILSALMKSGELALDMPLKSVPHNTPTGVSQIGPCVMRTEQLPWIEEEHLVDTDAAVKMIREKKPKIVWLGQSGPLFPQPIKELSDATHEVGGYLVEDQSHTLGLIAGKQWPLALKNGADMVLGSTHKTFAGPQGGLILFDDKDLFIKVMNARRTISANPHFNRLPSTAICMLEWLNFGEDYAKQIILNAQALGQALYDLDFKVGYPDKGFTQSHQIHVNFKEYAYDVSNKMNAAHIMTHWYTFLKDGTDAGRDIPIREERSKGYLIKPIPPKDYYESLCRLGVAEPTRLGMKESDMNIVAEFFKRVLTDNEDPNIVANDVAEFVSQFNDIKWSFDEGTGLGPYDLLTKKDAQFEYLKII